jgi:hypothetical protein
VREGSEECTHESGDLLTVGLEREVATVEEVQLGIREVAEERGSRRRRL